MRNGIPIVILTGYYLSDLVPAVNRKDSGIKTEKHDRGIYHGEEAKRQQKDPARRISAKLPFPFEICQPSLHARQNEISHIHSAKKQKRKEQQKKQNTKQ